MQIEQNKVITFHYTVTDSDGTQLNGSEGSIPMAYLHGHNNLLPALEAALAGLKEGDTKQIILSPKDAYGERKEGVEQRIPIKHIASKHKRLLAGMVIKVQTENGLKDATVVKPGKFMVNVDFNHPFAGKTLGFDVKIEAIRDASEDEIAHGHAHGVGGHHH